MINTSIFTRISSLSPSIQKEVMDYIEFLIQKHKKKNFKQHPKAGCMQGVFKVNPDFNEPLDDFKEYI